VIDHHPLMAYPRLDLANIAYWANRPRQCRDLAQSGLRYIADGPTAAMLHLKHGRASARLGEACTCRVAPARAGTRPVTCRKVTAWPLRRPVGDLQGHRAGRYQEMGYQWHLRQLMALTPKRMR